ncbi:MAG: serine hydrolase domain-containing protein [Pyrinomonadaceae bacterium]
MLLGDDLDRNVAQILSLSPPPGKTIQPEYKQITVKHLLEHTSGLSGEGDYEASVAFGISLPVSKYQAAAKIITDPFQFSPGSKWAYSNYGYAFLCLVIEKLTGSTYETYVRDAIFRAIGVERPFVGRSLLSERAPGEVVYHDAEGRTAQSNVHGDRRMVNICYGHMNMLNQAAFGGWVLSAPDYARLIAVYGPIFDFNHGGYYAGTVAWVTHLQSDRVGLVTLFNKDANGNDWDAANPALEYTDKLKEIADNLTKSNKWPTHNLFNSVDIPSPRRSWVDNDLSALLSAPSGTQPMGYIRADSVTSVIYTESNDHIREFTLTDGQWQHFDLTKTANAPNGKGAYGYVRADGVTTVVYRDSGQHIHELSLQTGKWNHADLTAHVNAPAISSGFQHSYVRSDRVTSTVYTGSDKHIHELALENGKWQHYDLTTAANATPVLYDPWGYMRSDDVTAVIYPGNDQHIHELSLQNGKWDHSDLTAFTNATPIKSAHLMGYVRADGRTSVPYLATDGHIHELVLQDGQWYQFDLTTVANAAPSLFGSQARPWGYVRADRVSAVVYRGTDGHIHELSLRGEQWQSLDLTLTAKAPSCASNPMGYVRADGVTAVVYQASDGHIHEITLQ